NRTFNQPSPTQQTPVPSTSTAKPPTSQLERPSEIVPSQTSTDIDSPIPLTSNVIEGLGIAEKVSHYYTFQGSPGYVEVTARARNQPGVAASALGVEILKINGTSVAKFNMGYTDQFKTETLQIPLGQHETLLMRVDLDPATLEYKIEITGAVNFK
ncbi:MAG: hypothetical protein F6K28_42260, partial [Microcoleus sp. SIO2G3]|nr:hypothetical protein [Microcoleus sp. SIO2G3]